MNARIYRLVLMLVLLLTGSGCVSRLDSAEPAEAAVQEVAGLDQVASLIGSQQLFFDKSDQEHTVYIDRINGLPNVDGLYAWNQPLILAPGEHHLTVAYQQGRRIAKSDLVLQAQAGQSYQLQFLVHRGGAMQTSELMVDVWIENVATRTPTVGVVQMHEQPLLGHVWLPDLLQEVTEEPAPLDGAELSDQ